MIEEEYDENFGAWLRSVYHLEGMTPYEAALAAWKARPSFGIDKPCPKCNQIPAGQGGEYPCPVCGVPLVHDSSGT